MADRVIIFPAFCPRCNEKFLISLTRPKILAAIANDTPISVCTPCHGVRWDLTLEERLWLWSKASPDN
jgi:hypothetical protein